MNERGEPHVVPVSFGGIVAFVILPFSCHNFSIRYNAEEAAIDIGGQNMGRSKKFRDAAKTGRAAFVVDDVLPP